MCVKSQIRYKNSSVVKNLQVLFDEQSSLPLIKRSSHPDLQRISSQTVIFSNCSYLRFYYFHL
jgi:rhodanese-related sulfurtransferase